MGATSSFLITMTQRRLTHIELLRRLLDSGWMLLRGGEGVLYYVADPTVEFLGSRMECTTADHLEDVLKIFEEYDRRHEYFSLRVEWPVDRAQIDINFNGKGIDHDHLGVGLVVGRVRKEGGPGIGTDRQWYEDRIVKVLEANGCVIGDVVWDEFW